VQTKLIGKDPKKVGELREVPVDAVPVPSRVSPRQLVLKSLFLVVAMLWKEIPR